MQYSTPDRGLTINPLTYPARGDKLNRWIYTPAKQLALYVMLNVLFYVKLLGPALRFLSQLLLPAIAPSV